MRNDAFLIEVGQKIRKLRKGKNITLEALYQSTGIARDNLSRIEAGKKNFHILTLKRIADVLEVNVKDFI